MNKHLLEKSQHNKKLISIPPKKQNMAVHSKTIKIKFSCKHDGQNVFAVLTHVSPNLHEQHHYFEEHSKFPNLQFRTLEESAKYIVETCNNQQYNPSIHFWLHENNTNHNFILLSLLQLEFIRDNKMVTQNRLSNPNALWNLIVAIENIITPGKVIGLNCHFKDSCMSELNQSTIDDLVDSTPLLLNAVNTKDSCIKPKKRMKSNTTGPKSISIGTESNSNDLKLKESAVGEEDKKQIGKRKRVVNSKKGPPTKKRKTKETIDDEFDFTALKPPQRRAKLTFLTAEQSFMRPLSKQVPPEEISHFKPIRWIKISECFNYETFQPNKHKYKEKMKSMKVSLTAIENSKPEDQRVEITQNYIEQELVKELWETAVPEFDTGSDNCKPFYAKKFWTEMKRIAKAGKQIKRFENDEKQMNTEYRKKKLRRAKDKNKKVGVIETLESDRLVLEIWLLDGTIHHVEYNPNLYNKHPEYSLQIIKMKEKNQTVEDCYNPKNRPISVWSEVVPIWLGRMSRTKGNGSGFDADPPLAKIVRVDSQDSANTIVWCTFFDEKGRESSEVRLTQARLVPNPEYKKKFEEFLKSNSNVNIGVGNSFIENKS